MKICKVEGCNNKYYGKGYCIRHYLQLRQYGKILKRTIFDPNEIIDCGNYCEICLYNNKCQKIARAKIDKEDLEKVKDYKWYIDSYGYATNKNKKIIKLHQLILGKKMGYGIDHINHNRLDNRKQNLRFVTHSQNGMNSKSKGYSWNKRDKKWVARICINYKQIYLGCFFNQQDAIIVRKQAEKKYFGKFAYNSLN